MKLITNYLEQLAESYPYKQAFVFTDNGEDERAGVTFAQLHQAVQSLSGGLSAQHGGHTAALLLYENALEFITAFLACQHAGITAVPMFFPKSRRHFERLELVIRDSGCRLVLCEEAFAPVIAKGCAQMEGMQPEYFPTSVAGAIQQYTAPVAAAGNNPVSFIQYTSGSTGLPKGVVVTHENLLHNQMLIKNTFGCNAGSVIMSWLPFYHDMGLVGNLLHTVYNGCTCVLMSPYVFIQNPITWLKAITRWKVTHTGGPNFAYDLCADRVAGMSPEGINLSSWQVAYNGSEPVSRKTMNRFIQQVQHYGFNPAAMFPCYGLAEATLLVSGGNFNTNDNEPLTCCGTVAEGLHVLIADAATGAVCADGESGEICVAGESVTPGYWNKNNEALFLEWNGQRYLKTGDTGYLRNNQLYISGRIKEMIIIMGENHFPYDIERTVFEQVPQVEPNGVIAFSDTRGAEKLVLVAELKREFVLQNDFTGIIETIERAVVAGHLVAPYDIALVKPRQLPRTSSGKLQRVKCRDMYITAQLETLATKQQNTVSAKTGSAATEALAKQIMADPQTVLLHQYLQGLISAKTGLQVTSTENPELTEMGIDSIKAMELINAINKDLEINLDANAVFQ
ncbi:MAG: AMP-binding protein, partial [Dinghuibacter sp.]|nr:AMP-binding protein [Dinghuibacter sp.]